MPFLGCERAPRLSCFLAALPHTPCWTQRRHLSSRNAWEGLVPPRCSGSCPRLFGTLTPNDVNAGGSAVLDRKGLLPDGAIIIHVATCQGRDLIVTIRSGENVVVIVNVHFEPDLVLRDLRERLRRISPHWPRYPEAFGVIIGDFNICESEEGRLNVTNQTFTEGDTGRTTFFRSFSCTSLKLRSPTSQGRTLLRTAQNASSYGRGA